MESLGWQVLGDGLQRHACCLRPASRVCRPCSQPASPCSLLLCPEWLLSPEGSRCGIAFCRCCCVRCKTCAAQQSLSGTPPRCKGEQQEQARVLKVTTTCHGKH